MTTLGLCVWLGIEFRTSGMLSRHSSPVPYSPPCILFLFSFLSQNLLCLRQALKPQCGGEWLWTLEVLLLPSVCAFLASTVPAELLPNLCSFISFQNKKYLLLEKWGGGEVWCATWRMCRNQRTPWREGGIGSFLPPWGSWMELRSAALSAGAHGCWTASLSAVIS